MGTASHPPPSACHARHHPPHGEGGGKGRKGAQAAEERRGRRGRRELPWYRQHICLITINQERENVLISGSDADRKRVEKRSRVVEEPPSGRVDGAVKGTRGIMVCRRSF